MSLCVVCVLHDLKQIVQYSVQKVVPIPGLLTCCFLSLAARSYSRTVLVVTRTRLNGCAASDLPARHPDAETKGRIGDVSCEINGGERSATDSEVRQLSPAVGRRPCLAGRSTLNQFYRLRTDRGTDGPRPCRPGVDSSRPRRTGGAPSVSGEPQRRSPSRRIGPPVLLGHSVLHYSGRRTSE